MLFVRLIQKKDQDNDTRSTTSVIYIKTSMCNPKKVLELPFSLLSLIRLSGSTGKFISIGITNNLSLVSIEETGGFEVLQAMEIHGSLTRDPSPGRAILGDIFGKSLIDHILDLIPAYEVRGLHSKGGIFSTMNDVSYLASTIESIYPTYIVNLLYKGLPRQSFGISDTEANTVQCKRDQGNRSAVHAPRNKIHHLHHDHVQTYVGIFLTL